MESSFKFLEMNCIFNIFSLSFWSQTCFFFFFFFSCDQMKMSGVVHQLSQQRGMTPLTAHYHVQLLLQITFSCSSVVIEQLCKYVISREPRASDMWRDDLQFLDCVPITSSFLQLPLTSVSISGSLSLHSCPSFSVFTSWQILGMSGTDSLCAH